MKKTAIITGVSSGLGKELALELIKQDYIIIGVSRNKFKDNTLINLSKSGYISHIDGDVSSSSTVQAAFAEAQKYGNFNLVINCAGQGVFGAAGNYKAQDIENVLKCNLSGTILFSDNAFAKFKETGGIIVNVLSTAGQVPKANETVYCASKWGGRGYTEALRLEAKNTPVKIIAVYPGGMSTDFWKNSKGIEVNSEKFMNPTEVAEIIVNNIFAKKSSYVSDLIINRN